LYVIATKPRSLIYRELATEIACAVCVRADGQEGERKCVYGLMRTCWPWLRRVLLGEPTQRGEAKFGEALRWDR